MSLTSKQQELVQLLRGVLPTAPAEVAQVNVDWYKEWVAEEVIPANTRRVSPADHNLYENMHALDKGTNLHEPSVTPAIWKRVWVEEWPAWVQPLGAHDAYIKGARVTHKGKKWISDVDANIWEPGVYGWSEYMETEA